MKRSLLYISAFLTLAASVDSNQVHIPKTNIIYTEPEGFTRRGKMPIEAKTKTVISYDKKVKKGSYYFHVYCQDFSAKKESERGYKKMYLSSSKWTKNERFKIGEWELFYDQFHYQPSKGSEKTNDRKRLFAFLQDEQSGLTLTITSTNLGSKENLIKLFQDFNKNFSTKMKPIKMPNKSQ